MAQTPNISVLSSWVTTAEVKRCDACTALDNTLADDMGLIASELLYVMSGRQFPGTVSRTVYPCGRRTRRDGPLTPLQLSELSHGISGAPGVVLGDCGCNFVAGVSDCTCTTQSAISLGGTPITTITEVVVDGAVLVNTAYEVRDFSWLVRTDGTNWPCCQDVDSPWTVEFDFGQAPPAAGVHAAAILACELALACDNDDACQLPKRVQTVTRQGMTAVLIDPFAFFEQGFTGIFEVDLFLRAFNPAGLDEDAFVLTPDIGPPVMRKTWP